MQRAIAARGHDHPQVGRRVAQQVGERLARLLWQPLGLVHDQHQVERRLRDLGQPGGDAFHACRRCRFEQRVAETRPGSADTHRQRQGLHQALRVVLRLRQQPGDHRPVRQMLEPPLRQQRGLAEAGRRLHQHHRVVAQARVASEQPRAHHQVTRHARRRDLEQQVIRRPGAGQVRRSRHVTQPAVARRLQPGWAIEQCMRDPNAHAQLPKR